MNLGEGPSQRTYVIMTETGETQSETASAKQHVPIGCATGKDATCHRD